MTFANNYGIVGAMKNIVISQHDALEQTTLLDYVKVFQDRMSASPEVGLGVAGLAMNFCETNRTKVGTLEHKSVRVTKSNIDSCVRANDKVTVSSGFSPVITVSFPSSVDGRMMEVCEIPLTSTLKLVHSQFEYKMDLTRPEVYGKIKGAHFTDMLLRNEEFIARYPHLRPVYKVLQETSKIINIRLIDEQSKGKTVLNEMVDDVKKVVGKIRLPKFLSKFKGQDGRDHETDTRHL